jgi:hypothetical protein
MFGLFGKKTASDDFWSWLAANTARIQSGLKQNPQGLTEEIREAFKKSYPDLVWEISPAPSPPWVFCVSADGKRELFPIVEKAVQAAPKLPGWKVQAFRPRGKTQDVEIEMGNWKLGYEDIWCRVERMDAGVRLMLLIRGLNRESDKILGRAALILLDNAVGEYDSVMKIKQLDRGPLPPNPLRSNAIFPLSDLPRFLDTVRAA